MSYTSIVSYLVESKESKLIFCSQHFRASVKLRLDYFALTIQQADVIIRSSCPMIYRVTVLAAATISAMACALSPGVWMLPAMAI